MLDNIQFSEPSHYTGNVLVVDDDEISRELMKDILEKDGHNVIEAPDGGEALKAVSEKIPDVVLLDIILPGINGFEVCKRLKEEPATSTIPVLMVTSLKERSDRIRGIKEGAADFISKPIDRLEVLLKVKNAVFSKHIYDMVREAYEKLKELELLRDNLTNMIVHDLRQPLTAISGYLQLFEMGGFEDFTEKQKPVIKEIMNAVDFLMEMVNSLLDISKLEVGKMTLNKRLCNIEEVVHEIIKKLGPAREKYTFSVEFPPGGISVQCDRDIIRRVITNILGNAVKFTPEGGSIKITAETRHDQVLFSIDDSGPGIPPEYHNKIFDKFGQVETRKEGRKYSTGLGLTFCKLAVEAHGGKIGVESEPGKGSTFWFVLPLLTDSQKEE